MMPIYRIRVIRSIPSFGEAEIEAPNQKEALRLARRDAKAQSCQYEWGWGYGDILTPTVRIEEVEKLSPNCTEKTDAST